MWNRISAIFVAMVPAMVTLHVDNGWTVKCLILSNGAAQDILYKFCLAPAISVYIMRKDF